MKIKRLFAAILSAMMITSCMSFVANAEEAEAEVIAEEIAIEAEAEEAEVEETEADLAQEETEAVEAEEVSADAELMGEGVILTLNISGGTPTNISRAGYYDAVNNVIFVRYTKTTDETSGHMNWQIIPGSIEIDTDDGEVNAAYKLRVPDEEIYKGKKLLLELYGAVDKDDKPAYTGTSPWAGNYFGAEYTGGVWDIVEFAINPGANTAVTADVVAFSTITNLFFARNQMPKDSYVDFAYATFANDKASALAAANDPANYASKYAISWNLNYTGAPAISAYVAEPKRDGHEFLGWATTPNATETIEDMTATTVPAADTTYYAIWDDTGAVEAENTVYVAAGGNDAYTGLSSEHAVATLSKAYSIINAEGSTIDTICISGTIYHKIAGGAQNLGISGKALTIKGYTDDEIEDRIFFHGDNGYADDVWMTTKVYLVGDLTFENITLQSTSNSEVPYAFAKTTGLTIKDGVTLYGRSTDSPATKVTAAKSVKALAASDYAEPSGSSVLNINLTLDDSLINVGTVNAGFGYAGGTKTGNVNVTFNKGTLSTLQFSKGATGVGSDAVSVFKGTTKYNINGGSITNLKFGHGISYHGLGYATINDGTVTNIYTTGINRSHSNWTGAAYGQQDNSGVLVWEINGGSVGNFIRDTQHEGFQDAYTNVKRIIIFNNDTYEEGKVSDSDAIVIAASNGTIHADVTVNSDYTATLNKFTYTITDDTFDQVTITAGEKTDTYKLADLGGEIALDKLTKGAVNEVVFSKYIEPPKTASYTIAVYTMGTDGEYAIVETTATAAIGDTVTYTPEEKTGFTVNDASILSGEVTADGSLVLKVIYDRNQYDLKTKADADADEVTVGTYYYGEAVTAPVPPEKSGFTFKGWNIEVPATMPASDVTLTATWEEIPADEPIVELNSLAIWTYFSDSTKQGTDNSLRGWGYDAIAQRPYMYHTHDGSDNEMFIRNDKTEATAAAADDMTVKDSAVYAVMDIRTTVATTPKLTLVEYVAGGETATEWREFYASDTTKGNGEWERVLIRVGRYGADGIDNLTEIKKFNIVPLGRNVTGATVDIFGLAFFDDEEIAEEYVLSARPNVGTYSFTVDGVVVTPDAENAPEKDGYTFKGWAVDGTETVYQHADLTALPIPAQDTVVNLSAIFDETVVAPTTANATFDANGGAWGEETTKTVETVIGETPVAPEEAPTRAYYTFKGWTPDLKVMDEDGETYTAVWEAVQYTITFANTGDTTIDPITGEFGAAVTAPADPTRAEYEFAGWDQEIPATIPGENITITAKWTAVPRTFENAVYVGDAGDDTADGLTAATLVKSMVRAADILAENAELNKIVIVGKYSKQTDGATVDFAKGKELGREILITGYTADAVFSMLVKDDKNSKIDSHFRLYTDVKFENIKIEGSDKDGGFATLGFKLTFGEGVTVSASQKMGANHYTNQHKDGSEINLNSGNFSSVNFAVNSGAKYYGTATVNVDGATLAQIAGGQGYRNLNEYYGIVNILVQSGVVGPIKLGSTGSNSVSAYSGLRYITIEGGTVGDLYTTGAKVGAKYTPTGGSETYHTSQVRAGVTVYEINGGTYGKFLMASNPFVDEANGITALADDDSTRVIILNNGKTATVEDEKAIVVKSVGGMLKAVTTAYDANGIPTYNFADKASMPVWGQTVALKGFGYMLPIDSTANAVKVDDGEAVLLSDLVDGLITGIDTAGEHTVEFVTLEPEVTATYKTYGVYDEAAGTYTIELKLSGTTAHMGSFGFVLPGVKTVTPNTEAGISLFAEEPAEGAVVSPIFVNDDNYYANTWAVEAVPGYIDATEEEVLIATIVIEANSGMEALEEYVIANADAKYHNGTNYLVAPKYDSLDADKIPVIYTSHTDSVKEAPEAELAYKTYGTYDPSKGTYTIAVKFAGGKINAGAFGLAIDSEYMTFDPAVDAETGVPVNVELAEGVAGFLGLYPVLTADGVAFVWDGSDHEAGYVDATEEEVFIATITTTMTAEQRTAFENANKPMAILVLDNSIEDYDKYFNGTDYLVATYEDDLAIERVAAPYAGHEDTALEITTADVTVNVTFTAKSGATNANLGYITVNGGKAVVIDDEENEEATVEYVIKDANVGEPLTIKVEKNGYIPYTLEVTPTAAGATVEIKMIAGDIKDSADALAGDGEISLDDFIRIVRAFEVQEEETDAFKAYKATVDINEDGNVNVTDLAFVKSNFGKTTTDVEVAIA